MKRAHIGIDAGHPTYDGDFGCTNGDLVESIYTMATANDLHDVAFGSDLPFIYHMLRKPGEQFVPLEIRNQRAENEKCDIVIHLHVNSSKDHGHRGTMALYWPGNHTGELVANQIVVSAPWTLKRFSRAFEVDANDWPKSYNLMSQFSMTSVLFEMGFASNPRDNKMLLKRWTRMGLVYAAVCGLSLYAQILEDKK